MSFCFFQNTKSIEKYTAYFQKLRSFEMSSQDSCTVFGVTPIQYVDCKYSKYVLFLGGCNVF